MATVAGMSSPVKFFEQWGSLKNLGCLVCHYCPGWCGDSCCMRRAYLFRSGPGSYAAMWVHESCRGAGFWYRRLVKWLMGRLKVCPIVSSSGKSLFQVHDGVV